MKKIKVFFRIMMIAGGSAFAVSLLVGLAIHAFFPTFMMADVLSCAMGTGFGCGLTNSVILAVEE